VIFIHLYNFRVIELGSFGEQLRVVVVRSGWRVLPVRQFLRNDINVVKGDFPLPALSKTDNPFNFGVYCLVFAYNHIYS